MAAVIDNDTVEIAQAALQTTLNPNVEHFLDLIAKRKPTAETLARAVVYASARMQNSGNTHVHTMLRAQLDLALTREHVAAQERMSRAATFLAIVGAVIAAVTLVAGFV